MPALRRTTLLFALLLPLAAQTSKQMARTADPAFEVAVIKPTDPTDRNQGFRLNGRQIFVENNTMTNIICFAYSIQKSQIVNAPPWFDEQPWNINGIPDTEGAPNWPQYRRMLQKLLSDRFGLRMHNDKRELSVYTLTVAKGGAKLEKSQRDPEALSDQSGHGVGQGQYMKFTNDPITDFARFLQLMVDRPVLDETNLPGHYDFTLLWTPDELHATDPGAPPGLFTALQQQLGLEMKPTRAPTDVFVVDAVTQPTHN